MKTQQILKGVLVDVDGTLLDSNLAHAISWSEALSRHGIPRETSQILPLIGMGGDQLLPKLSGASEDSELGKAISETRGEIFRGEHLPGLRPIPGARRLIEKLLDNGLKLVVASSSSKDDLEKLLEKAGVADLLRRRISADDIDASKPEPEIIHAGLESLGCRPEEALMLGDTPYDVAAAMKAGVQTVAVQTGGWSTERLRAAGAGWVYSSVGEIAERFEGSPFSSGNPRYRAAAI